jgi:hypothetical protein
MNDESGVRSPDSSFIIHRSPTEHLVTTQNALWLENKPDVEQAMRRVEAWFAGEMLDRPPVRFMAHNAFLDSGADLAGLTAEERRARWLDPEYQIDRFLMSIEGSAFHGETFPVYFPNLGPDVYAAFYGAPLHFGEVTSWSTPIVHDWDDLDQLSFSFDNPYFQKLEELTRHALERCEGRFMVGYTDLHPGLDCAAAWRDPQQLCIDMLDSPNQVSRLAELAIADFETIYDHFDSLLKAAGQLSVSWMGIPSCGRMHIPSCDFANLISPAMFRQFGLPVLQREVRTMTHNVFHVDGKRVARHLDAILSVPDVHAIQWVQGVGDDQPIMQWTPLIRQLQARKMPVIVDLSQAELDDFMAAMRPEGLFLWIAANGEDEQLAIIRRLEQWR